MTFEATQEEYRAAIERWLKNTTEEGNCRFWNGTISKNNLLVAKFKGNAERLCRLLYVQRGQMY